MAKNKSKRPPWYKFKARAEYNVMQRSYNEIQARVLPTEEAERFDVDLPMSWKNKPIQWVLNILGMGKKGLPPGSGVGLVAYPFSSIYTQIYGVEPIKDLPKYRKMFRTHPDIQEAIELQTTLAIGRGFSIIHENEKVVEYLTKLVDDINLLQTMLVLACDCLVYGNAYGEILWDEQVEKTEQVHEFRGKQYVPSELDKLKINRKDASPVTFQRRPFIAQVISKGKTSKTVVGIKPLDPIYMRVRRDSFGNVFGYVQKMTMPPILIDTDSMMHIKYRPKSWGYESAYGTSILMSLIKNNDLLEMFENDGAIWIHSRAVPPLIVQGGTPDKPYTTAQMKALMKKMATRTAASMIFVKSDVNIKELEGVAKNMNIKWWMDYLLTRRFQALGVPRVLMGLPEGTNRAVAEVVFQDFVTRLQLLQLFIGDAIETQVFYPIIKAKFGEGVEKARIVWKPIVEEDRNLRSERLLRMLQGGAISVNEFRMEVGFDKLKDEKFDEVKGPKEKPAKIPKGFPPQETVPEAGAPPPPGVGIPKKEPLLNPEQEFRVKKLRLLISQEQFKQRLLDLVETAKFELRQGDKLTKKVRKEILDKAKKIINQYVADAYLYGKLDSSYPVKMEDLTLKQEDTKGITKLKKKFLQNFRKILNDMVKAKGKGLI